MDLKQQMDRLKQLLNYDSFAEAVLDCVSALLVDSAARTIILASQPATELFGGELSGRLLNDLIPEQFHASHDQHVARYAAHPSTRPMGTGTMTLLARRLDGAEFPVEILLRPLNEFYTVALVMPSRHVNGR